jgi:RNA polymerase sigma-70 factor (ECF subfamily)
MATVTSIASSPAVPLLSMRRPAHARPTRPSLARPSRSDGTTRLDPATVTENLDLMYRVALAMCGSSHDAQDIVQDACVRLLARPRHLEHGRERAYLVVAVRHAWFDRLRARSSRPQPAKLDDHSEVLASPRPGPDEVVDAKSVFAAIAELAEPHRLAVAAVDVAGLSYADAAEMLGVPIGTIMSRLHRGRSRVAAALAPC